MIFITNMSSKIFQVSGKCNVHSSTFVMKALENNSFIMIVLKWLQKVIEACVILMAIFELLHFCLLHKNSFGSDFTTPSFVNLSMHHQPSSYSQANTPHMHHHHHGPMLCLSHDHRPSSPNCWLLTWLLGTIGYIWKKKINWTSRYFMRL